MFFFDPADETARDRSQSVAAELAKFLTDGEARVRTLDRMTPLTKGTAGSFLSPLKSRS
jgi:hypothetical protein